VHDAQRVAPLHNPDDGLYELRGLALAVVALGNDAVEELAAGTELHDDVDEERVLVGAANAHDVWVLGEMVHDLDLAVHVLVVLAAQQLALGDGFARVLGAVSLVHALVRGAELPLPQLLADAVKVTHVRRLVRQHGCRTTRRRRRRRLWQLRLRIGVPARVRLHCHSPGVLPGSRTVRTTAQGKEARPGQEKTVKGEKFGGWRSGTGPKWKEIHPRKPLAANFGASSRDYCRLAAKEHGKLGIFERRNGTSPAEEIKHKKRAFMGGL
jgi:hypothetical protein